MGLTDFVNKADCRVLPIMKATSLEGFETLVNPQNVMTSPLGWHNDRFGNGTNTV